MFSAITACALLFSFSFSTNTSTKITGFVTIKPIFPKGEKNLTTKQIDTLEKYVVKIHSTALRYKCEGASLCDQEYFTPLYCKEAAFFNLQNGRRTKLSREIGPGSAIRCTCQRSQARGFFKLNFLRQTNDGDTR